METKKIAKNTIWHFSAKSFGLLIGIVTIAIVTRYLGREGFGQYATALAWLQFFGIFVDFGLYMIMLSELGRAGSHEQESKIVSNILSLRIISAIIILGISIFVSWLMPYDHIIKMSIIILVWSFFFQLINQILAALFQKKLIMHIGSLNEIIGKALALILIIFIIHNNWGLLAIVAAISIANAINTTIMWLIANKYVKIKLDFDFSYWRYIGKLAWPLAIATIFNLFYFKADTIILSIFRPIQETGIYAAPYRILEVLISMPPIFLGLILPLLAKQWKEKNIPGFKLTIQRSLDLFHIAIIPLIIISLLLAEPIMILVAGNEFAISAPVLRLLIIATAFIFYSQIFSFAIVAMEKQKQILKFIISAAIIALILYFIFIPIYSYYAAAIITILIEGVIMLTFIYITHKQIKQKFSFNIFIKAIISSLPMICFILIFNNLSIIPLLFIAVIIYIISLFLTKALNFSEIKNLLLNKS